VQVKKTRRETMRRIKIFLKAASNLRDRVHGKRLSLKLRSCSRRKSRLLWRGSSSECAILRGQYIFWATWDELECRNHNLFIIEILFQRGRIFKLRYIYMGHEILMATMQKSSTSLAAFARFKHPKQSPSS
jgi:hypothetical protein